MQALAIFETDQSRRYVRELSDHFGSQASRAQPPFAACIDFPVGQCRLSHENAALTLCVEAQERRHLTHLMDLMTRYVERVAFREDPRLEWQISRRAGDGHSPEDDPTTSNKRASSAARP